MSSHARDFKGLNWDELPFVLRDPIRPWLLTATPRTIIGPITRPSRPSTLQENIFLIKAIGSCSVFGNRDREEILGPLNPKKLRSFGFGLGWPHRLKILRKQNPKIRLLNPLSECPENGPKPLTVSFFGLKTPLEKRGMVSPCIIGDPAVLNKQSTGSPSKSYPFRATPEGAAFSFLESHLGRPPKKGKNTPLPKRGEEGGAPPSQHRPGRDGS